VRGKQRLSFRSSRPFVPVFKLIPQSIHNMGTLKIENRGQLSTPPKGEPGPDLGCPHTPEIGAVISPINYGALWAADFDKSWYFFK
jgi:hypothetical protein